MHNTIRDVLSLFVVLSSLLFAGCAAVDVSPYPDAWPRALAGNTRCEAINGVYASKAQQTTSRQAQRETLLAVTLLPFDARLPQATRVAIEVADERFLQIVTYAKDGQVLVAKNYRYGDGFFRCEAGTLVVRPDKMPDAKRAPDNPIVGFSRAEIVLQKAEDGSLIMKDMSRATGLAFLVVPVHGESEQWFLFPASPLPE